MLNRIEARLQPRIDAARQRNRDLINDRYPSPVVAKVVNSIDPLAEWEDLTLEEKRDFIRATVSITVHRVRSRHELGVEIDPLKK